MAKKLKIDKKKPKSRGLLRCGDITAVLGTNIEINSFGKITVDGCLGVIEYGAEYINLRISKGSVMIYGDGFDIECFENKLITINGKIKSLEFLM